jgi:hypothetical protein
VYVRGPGNSSQIKSECSSVFAVSVAVSSPSVVSNPTYLRKVQSFLCSSDSYAVRSAKPGDLDVTFGPTRNSGFRIVMDPKFRGFGSRELFDWKPYVTFPASLSAREGGGGFNYFQPMKIMHYWSRNSGESAA